MIMHTLLSLVGEIFGDVEIGMLGWFDQIGLDFESEGSKGTIIDSSTSLNIFLDVFS